MALARRAASSTLKVAVPASTSNVGTGFDALGIALDHRLTATWSPAEKTSVDREGPLSESLLSVGRDPVLRGMRRAAILAGKDLPSGHLLVRTDFPPARGLGASGAGLVAGLLLGNKLVGGRLSKEVLLEEAIKLEGHPENATASLLGGATWSGADGKGGWVRIPVALHKDLRFLLIVPPYPLATKRAREVLPSSVAFARATAQASRVPLLLEGLRTLDPVLLRVGVLDELHVAPRLKLLTGAESMLQFADQAGALATTLSGAGSALLVLTRVGDSKALETRLRARVRRLWGESGDVLRAAPVKRGAEFVKGS
ncbi:MAG TPA: homoserine kinase [Planctomycetota bacterium]